MKTYLTYTPYIIFIVWICIVIKTIKNYKEFRRAIGSNFSIWGGMSLFKSKNLDKLEPKVKDAYIIYKNQSRALFWVWVLTLVIYMTVSIIVGIATR